MKILSFFANEFRPFLLFFQGLTPSFGRTLAKVAVTTAILLTTVVAPAEIRAAAIDPVRTWNEQAIASVRAKNAIDAQAARLYAMVNVAMYDAVNGIESRYGNGEDRAHVIVNPSGAPNGDMHAAAVAAAHAVFIGEYPDRAAIYDAQRDSDLAALGSSKKITRGADWGSMVGGAVRAARANDGSSPTEPPQPPGVGPGQFRANFTNPQFRNLAPFGIANSAPYYGAGPAPLPSLDYAASFDVVKVQGKTTPNTGSPDENAQKLGTFQFWALGNNTSQPPGAWIQIAVAVLETHPLELPDATRLLALETMAMSDTVAPTFMTKYVHHHWRPTTAIREADTDGNPITDQEATWTSRGGVGGTPEYWSGHSSFSAAAAEILARFFCNDNISFTFTADTTAPNPPNQPRTFQSFSAAAEDAGISRIYGGLHFPFSDKDGSKAGRAISREILANKLLRVHGSTHFGECPL